MRRLQEPARLVPAALKAMLFTPWSPHLNLPGLPRWQRPAYEEPVEAGALPRFIEIPTAPTTRNPKSETFVTTPGEALHGNPVAWRLSQCISLITDAKWIRATLEAQLESSKVWLCKKAFQGLKISPQAWGIHSTQKKRHELQPVDIRTIRRFDPLASHGCRGGYRSRRTSHERFLTHEDQSVFGTVLADAVKYTVMMNMAQIFLRNNLQLGTYANSVALRTASLQWCYSSRNFGANPTVSAGNGTGTDDDNRVQVDSLKKGKGKGKGKHQNQKGNRTNNTSDTSNTDINTCKNCC